MGAVQRCILICFSPSYSPGVRSLSAAHAGPSNATALAGATDPCSAKSLQTACRSQRLQLQVAATSMGRSHLYQSHPGRELHHFLICQPLGILHTHSRRLRHTPGQQQAGRASSATTCLGRRNLHRWWRRCVAARLLRLRLHARSVTSNEAELEHFVAMYLLALFAETVAEFWNSIKNNKIKCAIKVDRSRLSKARSARQVPQHGGC